MLSLILSFIDCAFYNPNEENEFLDWMRYFNDFYNEGDYKFRFGIWMTNCRYIKEHNRGNNNYMLGLNKFIIYTPAEYQALLGLKPHVKPNLMSTRTKFEGHANLDYRNKGVVNDIKDQSSCGSCWAFSAIQAVESAYALKTGNLISLSEQNLIDCVRKCHGCNGGEIGCAYDYIIEKQDGYFNKGSDYPYTGHEMNCAYEPSKGVCHISSYIYAVQGDESDLQAKIAQYGPASVGIDASHLSFQLYSNGIYDEKKCLSTSINHGVGCVGYGTENNEKYWIVRNSWGKSWGENGYIRMTRGKENQCGIATLAVIPIL